ncbi:hypothetical protein JCM1840_002601 [Sporobolomyces johnsonii]
MSDSASTAASVATLLNLPNELLSLILARPELDYLDLKCFSRVCRRFHALEQDTSLDYKLFRQGPAQRQVGKGRNVDFHPILDALLMTDTSLDKGMAYLSPKLQKIVGVPIIAGGLDWGNGEAGKEGRDGEWDEDDVDFLDTLDTISLPCASEYATSPASQHLKMQVFDDFTLHNRNGLTVRGVVVAVIERWAALEELAKAHVYASRKPETEAFNYLSLVRTRVTSSLRTALPSSPAAPPPQPPAPSHTGPPPPSRDETNEMMRQLEARMEAKLETEREAWNARKEKEKSALKASFGQVSAALRTKVGEAKLETEREASKARMEEETSALKTSLGQEIASLQTKAEEAVAALREEMRVAKAQEATKHAALQKQVNDLRDLVTQGKNAAVEPNEGIQAALKNDTAADLYGPAIGTLVKKLVTSELDRTTGPYSDGIVKRVEGFVKEQFHTAIAGPLLPAIQNKADEIVEGAFQAKLHDLEQRILDHVDASAAQYAIAGYQEGLVEYGLPPAVAATWIPPSMRNPSMQPPQPHIPNAPPSANAPARPRRSNPPPPPPSAPASASAPAPAPVNASSAPAKQRPATHPLSTSPPASTSRPPAASPPAPSPPASTIQSPLENPNAPVTQKQLTDHKLKTVDHLKKLQDKMWEHFERLKGEFDQVKKRVGEDGPASLAQLPVATGGRSPTRARTSSGASEEERPPKRARTEAPADSAVEQNRLAIRLAMDEAMKKLEKLEAALEQGIAKVTKGQEDLTRRVSGVERDNTGLSDDIASVKDRQRTDRASTKAEIKALEDLLNEKVDRTTFDAKIREVDQPDIKQVIGIVHDRVPAIVRDQLAQAGVNAVAGQLEDIFSRVNTLDAAQGEIKKEHADAMEIAHGNISDFKEETRSLSTRLDTLDRTVAATADVGAKLAELSQSVATLQALPRPPDLSARVEVLEKDLNMLSDGTSTRDLASKIAELRGTVESQQAKLDVLGKPTPPASPGGPIAAVSPPTAPVSPEELKAQMQAVAIEALKVALQKEDGMLRRALVHLVQPLQSKLSDVELNLKTTSALATTTIETVSETKQRLQGTVNAINSQLWPVINTIHQHLGNIQREAMMAATPASGPTPQPPMYTGGYIAQGGPGPSSMRPGQPHPPQHQHLPSASHQPLHQQTRLAQSQSQRPPSPFSQFAHSGAPQDGSR